MLGQIPAGIAIDKLGVKRILLFATLLAALGSMLFSFANSVTALLVARAALGFAGGFAFVSALKLASVYFSPRLFPLLAGFTQLLGYLGAALSGAPLAHLMSRYNWRDVYFVIALVGVLIFFMTVLFVRHWHSDKKSKRYQSEREQHVAPPLNRIIKQSLKLCAKPQMLLNGLYCTFMMGATSVFSALWGINYLITVKGTSEPVAALTSSLVFIGVAVASPFWGILASIFSNVKLLLISAAILASIDTYCLLYVHIGTVGLYITGFLFGVFQSVHILNFAIVQRGVDSRYLGSVLALLNMFTSGGGALLQPFTGILIEYSHKMHDLTGGYSAQDYKFGLMIIPLVQLFSFVISWFLIEKRQASVHEIVE